MALGESHNACLVYGDCDFVEYEGRFLFTVKSPEPSRIRGLVRHSVTGFAQPAAIFRMKTFEELGGFDERYRHIADYDFFLRLVLSRYPLARLRRPTAAAFRVHASQLSTKEGAVVKAELKSLRRALDVRTSLRSLFDLLCWRLQNSPDYLWRLARHGRLRAADFVA